MKDCNCSKSFSTVGEYPCSRPACIRKKEPDCLAKAVIPAITVDTIDGITELANCFVHVTEINTTFYIDDKHRPMMVWAGDVEVQLPSDVQTEEEWMNFIKSFNLKEQFLYVRQYDNDNNRNVIEAFYFDKSGRAYRAGEFEEATEA